MNFSNFSFITYPDLPMSLPVSNYGKKGLGDNFADMYKATTIPTIADVKQIAVGDYHTLYLTNDGKVKASGFNNYGQLGFGDNDKRNLPTEIPNLENVVAIAAGANFSVFLLGDKTVKVCGFNPYANGGLGFGYAEDYEEHPIQPIQTLSPVYPNQEDAVTTFLIPTAIPDVSNIKDIAAGDDCILLLNETGKVYGIGSNGDGQLGLGAAISAAYTPIQIPGLDPVDKIATESKHTILLMSDKTVRSCGQNNSGELGLGDNLKRYIPTLIPFIGNVIGVVAGSGHSVFILEDKTVKTCGNNKKGQLGYDVGDASPVPQLVEGISNVAKVIAQNLYTIFVEDDGTNKTVKIAGYMKIE